MGSFRLAALAALLLAFALLPDPAAARVLQGKKPGSGEEAPVPNVATGGSEKGAASKEPGQPSTPAGNPETGKQHQKTPPAETTPTPPPPETTQTPPPPEKTQTPKDSPPPPSGVPESKGQKGSNAEVSAQPVPAKNGRNESPPPGSPESTGGGSGNKKPATESKEVAEECKDPVDTCSIEGLSACLQVSKTASSGQFFIVQNTGQNTVTVDVKTTSDISIAHTLPPLSKGESKRVNISSSSPNGGEVTLNVGTGHCVLRIRQPVYDWQQQFQQLTSYATTVKPIYGAYFGVFTLVLVGAVFACCKFAGTKRDGGVPYQQLEMGSQAQAPDSSGANNTTSTGDGWEDGWDDDWDDEEAPAKPSERGPAGSISANGLSLRSPTNRSPTDSKDGWDVDWDD
ncbi:nascent polypeptide-associated complex subunit alpha, muscle-specific form [Triticum urartu]|uniref:nascent polypeptide-associated complex subunit alpha, muscle-specific form n=1 Tax=Triticum urartu TaxID=4572 RepID=UPI0020430235|nr:nascent polypeptide-associated complex subunit alpha, muscle-specific form [Triticum urartu]